MEDGIHILITNFISYKERLHGEEMNSYRQSTESIVYSEPSPSYEYTRQSSNLPQEEINPPVLSLGDKLPLSMLLCLLADGRQLSLEEIDRVLVYLLEKKAKMLTLPSGTLPPLPAQYATITTYNHSAGALIFIFLIYTILKVRYSLTEIFFYCYLFKFITEQCSIVISNKLKIRFLRNEENCFCQNREVR